MRGQVGFILRAVLTVIGLVIGALIIMQILGWDVWGAMMDFIADQLDRLKEVLTFGIWD